MNDMIKLKLRGDDKKVDSSHIDNIIGQTGAKKMLSFFAKSHSKDTPFPTTIFTGSQGLGKTYTAEKVAKALGRDFIEVNCKSVKTVEDFFSKIWFGMVFGRGDGPVTLLLDESHGLSQEITDMLLSVLNPNETNKNTYAYQDKLVEFNLEHVNMIFATTDAHMMFKPLLSRCEEITFNRYTEDELSRILALYLPDVTLNGDNTEIAEACRGRGRDAFKLSQNIKRHLSMNDTNVLSESDWNELKDTMGIWPKGLWNKEIDFMNLLMAYAPISSRNIAIKMGVNVNNIEDELEIRPRELGMIENTSKGRVLTELGIEYMTKHA